MGHIHASILFLLFLSNLFLIFTVVFGDTGEEKSVMEGENITLPSDVKQPNETVLWYFEDTRIALINGEPSTSCLYYGKGEIFRDRLDVDYKTGSLIITDIRSEHAGRYETEIIRGNSTGKSVPLNRKSNCDSTNINNKSSNNSNTIKTFNVHVNGSGLSPAVVAGIVVGVLLVAAAVVVVGLIYYRRRNSRNAGRRNNEEVLQEDEERCSLGSPEISS
uniref:Uncharacterized protein n=1 Tax=Cyprinus carpio carpio TaxID=630221 RepID=A0A9J8CN69_CYPCA